MLDATVVSTTSKTGTAIAGKACAAATVSVDALTSGSVPSSKVAPPLFPRFAAADLAAASYPSASCTTLTLHHAHAAGKDGVPWEAHSGRARGRSVGHGIADTPTFTILFGFDSVGLSTLVSPGAGAGTVGVGLSHAWLPTTTVTAREGNGALASGCRHAMAAALAALGELAH